jgi:hypothetical protein
MANTLTAIVPKLLASGLLALRENAIMPRLVNRAYEAQAGQRGSTIDVPIPSALVSNAVSPGAVPPAGQNMIPTTVPIALDSWQEVPFHLTDKEELEIMDGLFPMQASEAIKTLANDIDNDILSNYVSLYGTAGVANIAGSDHPFATDTSDATEARRLLNTQLAPLDPRYGVVDPDAEANALNLRAFQDASWAASPAAIIDGQLNKKLGIQWFMDQNIPTHTAGAGSGYVTNGTQALGATSIILITGSGDVDVGDIVTFAGHTQQYTVTTAISGPGTLVISPGLQEEVLTGVAMTSLGSHTVNLVFHRDCFAYASRPLQMGRSELGVISQSVVDPISGIALRLEVTHEHKRMKWSFDALWGSACIRPALGVRLAGQA